MKSVIVHASHTYTVRIGKGILGQAGTLLKTLANPPRNIMLVTDSTTEHLFAPTVISSFEKEGYTVRRFSFPAGEHSKNLTTLSALWNRMAEEKFTRVDLVVALGGGVVGDLAGFAAATFLRGIEFLHIPTTLLSMVDSSVGGKTAIDLDAGKNLCGVFAQPLAVLADTETLKTLPERDFYDGCAEVIKYGYIGDSQLLKMLKRSSKKCISDEVIARCIEDKRKLVEEDECDKGSRRLLNFGHTVGHAIEKLSDYTITHGQAVAMGMMLITRASVKAGLCHEEVPPHMESLLKSYFLPTECPFTAKELAEVAILDKKRSGDKITLVIPDSIGKSRLLACPISELEAFFEGGIKA